MKATGRIEIIRDAGIREQVSRLIQAADYQLRATPQFQVHTAPWFVEARQAYYFDVPAESDLLAKSRKWDRLHFDITSACQDPRFVAAVGNTREATLNLVGWNTSILGNVQNLSAALEAEAGRRKWSAVAE